MSDPTITALRISRQRPKTAKEWEAYAHRAAYLGHRSAVLDVVRRDDYPESCPALWADAVLGMMQKTIRELRDVYPNGTSCHADPTLYDGSGLSLVDDIAARPHHPEGLREGCMLALEASYMLLARNGILEEHGPWHWAEREDPGSAWQDHRYIAGLCRSLNWWHKTPANIDPGALDRAIRILGQRAGENLLLHPPNETESGLLILANTLQRLAFAASALRAEVPWLALCDAWGQLVAPRAPALLGRPLNRLGRSKAVLRMESLWATSRAKLKRSGLPSGRVETFEGWCVLVYLMAGLARDAGESEWISTVLAARPAVVPIDVRRPLAIQAIKAVSCVSLACAARLQALAVADSELAA